MLRKIVNVLIVLPLAILFVIFAVANRHFVTLSFDPFNAADPSLSLTMPLFVVIIATAMFGVVAGGIAVWFGQHRWRKAARRHEAEARAARAQLADLRGQGRDAAAAGEGLVPGSISGRLPAPQVSSQVPSPAQQYAAIGRDKTGATL